MPLNLYMVGLNVQSMSKAAEFYRRLGLVIPEGIEGRRHVQIKMQGEYTLFLDTRSFASDAPTEAGRTNGQRVLLEFYLGTQAAVDAKCAELAELGYHPYPQPLPPPPGMYFQFIEDPDGNPVLLSGDLEATP